MRILIPFQDTLLIAGSFPRPHRKLWILHQSVLKLVLGSLQSHPPGGMVEASFIQGSSVERTQIPHMQLTSMT